METLKIRMNKRAGTLIEVLIVAIMIGIITAALLRLYNFARDLRLEARQTLSAINALDVIMANFEDSYITTGYLPLSYSSGTMVGFTRFDINKLPNGSDLVNNVLDKELRNWGVSYIYYVYNGTATSQPSVAICIKLHISWDGVHRDIAGTPLRKSLELYSIFTPRGKWPQTLT